MATQHAGALHACLVISEQDPPRFLSTGPSATSTPLTDLLSRPVFLDLVQWDE